MRFTPGRRRGSVVELYPRIPSEPIAEGLVFVDVHVVRHHMEFPIGIRAGHVVHETQKDERGAPVADMGDHFAGGNLQSNDECLRSVPHVLIGPTPRFLGAQRQQRLGSIRRRMLGFLSTQRTSAFSGGFI